MRVAFAIPGPPQPWVRWRVKGWSRWHAYREHVRYSAAPHVPKDWPGADYPKRRLDLTLRMFFPDLRVRDADNVEHGIVDALNGVLWQDDRWTTFCGIHMHPELDRENPRVELACEVVSCA